MARFDLVKELKGFDAGLQAQLTHLGNANSPEMRAMRNTLARSMRKVLSVSGGGALGAGVQGPDRSGHVSRPGEPPRAQTKRLMRSVKTGVVGTGSRVGTLAYYGAFHEEGVDTDLPLRSGSRRRRKGGKAKRTLKLPRRPFLQASLDAAREQMVDVFAEVSSARLGPVEFLRG